MTVLRCAGSLAVALLAAAGPAQAAELCVEVDLSRCDGHPATLVDALDAAGPNDTILLGPRTGGHVAPTDGAFDVAERMRVVGVGDDVHLVAAPDASVTAWLSRATSRLENLVVVPPAGGTRSVLAAGALAGVVVTAPQGGVAVELLPGGRLADATVNGPALAAGGTRVERSRLAAADGAIALAAPAAAEPVCVVVENVVLELDGAAAGLDAGCSTTIAAHHVSVSGAADRAARAVCEGAAIELRDTFVDAALTDVGEGAVSSAYSAHAEDPDVVSEQRLEPGVSLVDVGDPAPLGAGEGSFDTDRRMRVVDGDGNGVLRRDVGAFELQPPAPAVAEGNVLANPGAELGQPAGDDLGGPAPPDWTRLSGDATSVLYGVVVPRVDSGDVVMPTEQTGAALAAGRAYFSGGGTLLQRIDISGSAAAVDAGGATARLAALLGGYGAEEDTVRVEATFRDPEGVALGTLAIGPVSAIERANATGLVHRSAMGTLPPRTRALDVTITGTRAGAGSYTDAYADNLALVLSVPGAPVPGPVDPGSPPVKNLKPFAGVTVLSPRLFLTRPGQVRVRVACASATVGGCRGTLEVRARVRRGQPVRRIARFGNFALAPGARGTVAMRLIRREFRVLRRRRSFPVTLRAVARDGQGLERARTVPLRVRRSRGL